MVKRAIGRSLWFRQRTQTGPRLVSESRWPSFSSPSPTPPFLFLPVSIIVPMVLARGRDYLHFHINQIENTRCGLSILQCFVFLISQAT